MRKLFFVILLLPLCISCIWDRDTLAADGEGRIDTAKTIVGWFDRNPPEYYEMRLKRVLKELESQPDTLELYDDASVALDRLHRSDEAIALIKKKEGALERLKGKIDESIIWEHQYRYLANLGTFHAHRWIGTDPATRNSETSDLEEAERLISAAIKHNPDAHFGREIYQLEILRTLLSSSDELSLEFSTLLFSASGFATKNESVNNEAIEGLSGMIQLGAAWESTDIHTLLGIALQSEGRNSLGYAANLRVKELQELGKESLSPTTSIEKEYMAHKTRPRFLESDRQLEVKIWFKKARQASDERHEARTNYMISRFAQGQHPDTHPNFWADWQEPEFPPLELSFFQSLSTVKILIFIGIASLLLAIGIAIRKRLKRSPNV